MQVNKNVHRLTQGVANFYLIEESGRFTLIDAGTPGDWSYFRRSLAALGGSLTDLDAVLLTHAHPDHTLMPRARYAEIPGAYVLSPPGEPEAVARETGQFLTSTLVRDESHSRCSLSICMEGCAGAPRR